LSKHLAERCDGLRLCRGLSDAAAWLDGQAAEINALNVFPVPDGDTGTNMSLTLQAAVRQAIAADDNSVAAVAKAAAQGALLGARGNSGVILSQFLRGIARSLEKQPDCGPAELAQALALGSATAHKAVIRPVEGTMLTVGRDAAQAALTAAEDGADLLGVLEAAAAAARASVARTPSLLPVLRQAGVVDAGGQGLLCLLEGLYRSLSGELAGQPAPEGKEAAAELAAPLQYGYCTEFLLRLRGRGLDLEAIRAQVVGMGDSALVVGENDVVRVHLHTFHPGLVLEWAGGLGTLHQIKIDNMQDQHQDILLAQARASGQSGMAGPVEPGADGRPPHGGAGAAVAGQPAMVAVAAGEGFASIFRSLGVGTVVPGGQTMNPSTEDLLRAVREAPARQVLLLPNNGNILLAARQVQLLTDKQLAVIPTQDMAQGVAAALAFQPGADLAANARTMERALCAVRTGEVTAAVRAARLDGFEVGPGELLGLVGGQLVAVGGDQVDVVRRMLEKMGVERGQVVTLYYGAEVDAGQAQSTAALLRARLGDREVEVVSGGQPLYHYVVSVE